ncbi:hypothetical protein FACS1894125_3070 [Actinomycetota bacterium]|nr:hypothetical protein FACS1894125_3070 [Actinomycetota bacterium]
MSSPKSGQKKSSPKSSRTFNLAPNLEDAKKRMFREVLAYEIAEFLPTLLSVVLAAFLTLFTLVLLNITTSLFDPPSVSMSEIDNVIASFTIATGLWLSGNGLWTDLGEFNFDFIPLGVTLLCALMIYFCALRLPLVRLRSILAGSAFYVVGLMLFYAFLNHSGGFDIIRNLSLPFFLSFLALFCANRPKGSIINYTRRLVYEHHIIGKLPKSLFLSLRTSISIVASIMLVTAVVFGIALYNSFTGVADVFAALNAGPWTAVVIAFYCLMFLPNILVFTTSQLFSSGFAIGDFALFQTGNTVDTQNIPPFPLFSASITVDEMQISPLSAGVTLFILGLLLFFWQTRKLKYAILFQAYSQRRVVVSQICYQLFVVVLTLFEVLLAFVFLGYVSSGSIGTTIGFIGVDCWTFGLDITYILALSSLIPIVFYSISILLTPKEVESAIIVKETRQEMRHIIEEEHHTAAIRKGKRHVKSTR